MNIFICCNITLYNIKCHVTYNVCSQVNDILDLAIDQDPGRIRLYENLREMARGAEEDEPKEPPEVHVCP